MRSKRAATFVAAIAVLVVLPLVVTATDTFVDVPEGNVHHDNIAWLADTGVTRGCNPPDNTEFCPEDAVTRQQMASFLRRLAEGGVVDAGALGGRSPLAYETVVASSYCGPNESLTATSCGATAGGTFPGDTTWELLVVDIEAPEAGTLEVSARAAINLAGAPHLFWVTMAESCTEFTGATTPILAQALNMTVFVVEETLVPATSSTMAAVPAGDHRLRLCALRPGPSDAEVLVGELSARWNAGGTVDLQTAGGGSGLELPEIGG